mgnify:CR=1 FL=1
MAMLSTVIAITIKLGKATAAEPVIAADILSHSSCLNSSERDKIEYAD